MGEQKENMIYRCRKMFTLLQNQNENLESQHHVATLANL